MLNLAETTLESIPDGFLHALHSLEVLLLNGNRLTTVPAELRRSPGLQLLNLNDNPIQRLNASSFEGVSGLRQLNISAMNRLESIDENTFSGLKSLTSLWCSFNPSLKRIHSRAFMGIAADKENLVFSEVHILLSSSKIRFNGTMGWIFPVPLSRQRRSIRAPQSAALERFGDH